MKRSYLGFFPIVLLSILFFFLFKGLYLNPSALPSVKVGQPLPSFILPEVLHQDTPFNVEKIHPKPYALLNVWASWCSACLEEHSFLMSLSKQGVLIYGFSYKDEHKEAYQWLMQHGNPYQLVALDTQGTVAIDLGVYGAPETFLLNEKREIIFRYAGILTKAVWTERFLPYIKEMRNEKNNHS